LKYKGLGVKGGGRVYLTGNIGEIQPFEFLENLAPEDWVVYELSSFQLQDLDKSPHIGVVLMVTEEHLDYHKDATEYRQAKTAVVKFQNAGDFAVINADFPGSLEAGGQGLGQKFYFSRKTELEKGCFVSNGNIVAKGLPFSNFQFPTSRLQLRGEHNYENVCAAVLASLAAGADAESVAATLKNFRGLRHRLQLAAEKDGTAFYNDSFSTVPETAIAAINSFYEPEIVILGGSSKHSDFSELGRTICGRDNIKGAILIGDEAPRIKEAIEAAGTFRGRLLEGARDMAEIFSQIRTLAKPGDVVLLSPACASFGMFKNYKDRGEQFIKAAEAW
ncbi:MAG TPA: UDP-N-acetylmuramoyl-L-alanine--D-glutamate ligase, partial [Patescibacteria group bacterium]|nr:UDP-N-acetylmuramoyl-L-alanine--D-glutamate ligase [Patescibacteria group bacterium]